jgi:hypothetical protein
MTEECRFYDQAASYVIENIPEGSEVRNSLSESFKKGKWKHLSIYVSMYLLITNHQILMKAFTSNSAPPVTVSEFGPAKVVSKFIRIADRKIK